MNYAHYITLLETLLKQGKTTGFNQSADYLNYAKINLQRMHRLEKTVELKEDLKTALSKVSRSYIFLIITEGWCGDAAQNLPVFNLIEKSYKNFELKLILRDENPHIMANYLTNGAQAIPKVICLEKNTLKEVFVWGPRPQAIQQVVLQMKQENKSLEEKGVITQNWYNADKSHSLQHELLNLVQNL